MLTNVLAFISSGSGEDSFNGLSSRVSHCPLTPSLSPRKRTTSQSKTEPPLLRTNKRTIYTAGRPPWYNVTGTTFKEAFVIGESTSSRKNLCPFRFGNVNDLMVRKMTNSSHIMFESRTAPSIIDESGQFQTGLVCVFICGKCVSEVFISDKNKQKKVLSEIM